jgi:hypothetical protein
MSDELIRDPAEMKLFAAELENYAIRMKRLYTEMGEYLSAIRNSWDDPMANKTMSSIEHFRDAVKAEIPICERTVTQLRESANKLERLTAILGIE